MKYWYMNKKILTIRSSFTENKEMVRGVVAMVQS